MQCGAATLGETLEAAFAVNPLNIQDAYRIVRCAGAPDTLWCKHHGGIWRSTDNAASWHEITGAPVSSFGFAVAVHPSDPDIAWFVPAEADQRRVPVGAAMIVNRTRGGGKTFDTQREVLPQQHAYDLVYRHGLAAADWSGRCCAIRTRVPY